MTFRFVPLQIFLRNHKLMIWEGSFHSPYPTSNKNHFNKEISLSNKRGGKTVNRKMLVRAEYTEFISVVSMFEVLRIHHTLLLSFIWRAVWQTDPVGRPLWLLFAGMSEVMPLRGSECSIFWKLIPRPNVSPVASPWNHHFFLKTQTVPSKGMLGQWKASFSCAPHPMLSF